MNVAERIHTFYPVRPSSRRSTWDCVRSLQRSAVRHLSHESSLWGAIGVAWALALAAFSIVLAATGA